MSYWRFRSEAAIKVVGFSATRVAWQPGQGGQLACITLNANPGGRLVNTGIVKKDSIKFGAGMGGMEELAWSPAGDMLATVGERAIIWNSSGTFNRELQVPPMGENLFDTPKFSKDGSFIVLSIMNFGWPTSQREFRKFFTSTGALQQTLRISVPMMMLRGLAWKDELEVFSGGENNTINLWRIGQEEPLQTITLTDSSVHKMSFNPRMNILAFTSASTVRLWKMDTPDMAVTILPHDAPVSEFVWQSDDSDILATFDTLGDCRIWETTTNINLYIYNVFVNNMRVIRASFSPNGRFVAVGGKGEVKLIKCDTGGTVAVCEGSGDDVKWSPKGDKLAVNRLAADAMPTPTLLTYITPVVFNVDQINFGINLKGLCKMRVVSLLEGNLVNGKEEAKNFLENKIPEKLVDVVLEYL